MNDAAAGRRPNIEKVDREVGIGEDLEFQRSWWRFEHSVWAVFALIIVADLVGALGRGPLAYAHLQTPSGNIQIDYERIERTGTPAVMTVKLGQGVVRDGKMQLFVSDDLINQLGVMRVIPEPASTAISPQGLTYTFPASAPAVVRFQLEPKSAGRFGFDISTPALPDDEIAASVFVVP